MRKVYRMEDLECANCAAKMQDAISRIEGVNSVSISFMAQKMTLDADEGRLDAILDAAQKAVSKFERDCVIVR